jgi:ATP-dependent Lhr-like helicase
MCICTTHRCRRMRAAETAFNQGHGETCVICTSTMELGIDIGDLDQVVQYGPPCSIASFLQRMGRVGEREQPAVMTFILQNSCDLLITVATIESAIQHKIEPLTTPTHAYHVMVQQLFLQLKSRHRGCRRRLSSYHFVPFLRLQR